MADAYVAMHLHEQRYVYGELDDSTGTLTLAAATVTLYDASGAVAGGVNGATATGYTSSASASPQAWYLLKPTVLGIAAGLYTLAFLITDSNGLIYEPVIGVRVTADYV